MAKRVGLLFWLVLGFLAGSAWIVQPGLADNYCPDSCTITHSVPIKLYYAGPAVVSWSASCSAGNLCAEDNVICSNSCTVGYACTDGGVNGPGTFSASWTGLPSGVISFISLEIKMKCIQNVYRAPNVGNDYYFYGLTTCGSANTLITVSNSTNSELVATIGVTDTNTLYTYNLTSKVKPSGGTYSVTIQNQKNYIGNTFLGAYSLLIDYVSLNINTLNTCACSTPGPCCDGCNVLSGFNCGTQACPSASYYKDASNNCHKIDYPATCTKTCDSSGNCNDCCSSQDAIQDWTCGTCLQKNLLSCSGSTGPLCENTPYGTQCTSDSNSCTNDICSSGVCTHPAFCAGTDASCGCTSCVNCPSSNGYYDSGVTQWISSGACTEKQQKQVVYRNYYCYYGTDCAYTSGTAQWVDTGSTRNKAAGVSCTTSQGYLGTCSAGTCMPKPTLSVSANLYPPSINVDESTTLSGAVTCLNGDCGTVYVYPKGPSNEPLNTTVGLNVTCIPGNLNCFYSCQTMGPGSSCTPSWTITGKNSGTYPMFLIVTSTTISGNQSSTINLNVNEIPLGSITITSFSPDSSVITKGSSTTVRANIICSGTGTKCGNITFDLSYSPAGGLTVSPGSTSCIELKGGQACPASWTVWGSTSMAYNLYVSAYSDISEVDPFMSQTVLTVTDKPFIQINNINLVKNAIKTGESTALSAEIKCQSGTLPCGTVKASLKYNGTTGLTIQNPEINCGNMVPSSACPVSWGIMGNNAGVYELNLSGYSTDPSQVQNSYVTKVLGVSKNLGNLSIPQVKVTPSVINNSNSATLSATVNCAGYCGSVSVQLKVGGVLLNSMTFLSTTDQNPKSCYSFPCYLSWNLTGNSVGPFDIIVNATSNESLYAINGTNLQVIDPNNPSLGVFSNLGSIKNSAPNQAVSITANVKCFTKDCGQTTVALSYNNGAGWIDIGSSGIVHSQSQNPVALGNMKVGDSNDLSWGIAFLAEAVYQLRITANGTALNLKNGESTGTINVSQGMLDIFILSPHENESFSLGDVISLKARITRDGVPASGLSPIVTSQLFSYIPNIFYLPGDGTYTGNASVPSKKVGNYQLVFWAEDSQSQVNIFVSPELSVTLRTDKYSYAWTDKIEISGDVKKKGTGTPANITIKLASGDWNDVINLRTETGYYSRVYENRMPKEGGKLKLEVIAKDYYGNAGNQSAEVGVSAYTGDSYNLSFDMGRNSYNRGDNMTILVRVSEMNVPKSGLRVNCTFLGMDIELSEGENGYYGYYAIRSNTELGNKSLSCSVAGPKPGQGYETITVEPMSLRISIFDPEPSKYRDTDVISAAPEEPIRMKVGVFYPDGKPVTDAVVEVMLGGNKTNMTQTDTPGIYAADVRFTKQGAGIAMSTIFLTAQDSQGNRGKNNVGLVVGTGDFNWWWLLLIPAGLAILFVVYLYIKSKEEPPKIQIQEKIIRLPTVERVREIIYKPVRMPARPRVDPAMKLKDEIDRLEEKSKTTQDAKDLAEQQYYKRQIDEATFNKLMQNYEEKLIELDAAIRQKKKELYEMEPE